MTELELVDVWLMICLDFLRSAARARPGPEAVMNRLNEKKRSRSLHCAAGARVRERRKKPAAPVGMTGAEEAPLCRA